MIKNDIITNDKNPVDLIDTLNKTVNCQNLWYVLRKEFCLTLL